MSTTPAAAPKLRNFLFRNLVDKADPQVKETTVTEYVFSNGRKFTRYVPRNRTS